MNIRQLAAVIVVAATSLVLLGCGNGQGGTTLSPEDAFLSALTKLNGQGYDLTLSAVGNTLNGAGSVDPRTRSATIDETGTIQGTQIEIAAIEIGTALWVKANLGPLGDPLGIDPSRWLAVDRSKLTSKNAKPFDFGGTDPFDVGPLFIKVDKVVRTDSTRVSGVVDLTAATGVSAPDAGDLQSSGDAAKSVPFTATLDGQGRLTKLSINADAFNPNLSQSYTFTNYGSPTTIQAPPAAQVSPAPSSMYSFLNNGGS